MPNTNDNNEQLNIPSFLLNPVSRRVDTNDTPAHKDEPTKESAPESKPSTIDEADPELSEETQGVSEPKAQKERVPEEPASQEEMPLDVIVLDRDDSAQVKAAAVGKVKHHRRPKHTPEPGTVRVLKPVSEEDEKDAEKPEEKPLPDASETEQQDVPEQAEAEVEAEPETEAEPEAEAKPEPEAEAKPEPEGEDPNSEESEIEAMMASVMQAVQGIKPQPEAAAHTTDEADDVNKKMEAALRAMSRFANLPTIDSKKEPEKGPESNADSQPLDDKACDDQPKSSSEAEMAPEPEPSENVNEPEAESEPIEPEEPEPTLEEDLEAMAKLERRLYAHRYATLELEAFGSSIDPSEATEDRREALAVLAEEDHELMSTPEVGSMLDRLKSHADELEPLTATQVKILSRDHNRIASVPAALEAQLVKLTSESYEAWLKARENADWRVFAPYLDRLVSLKRKVALAQNPDADPYDTLLDEFEPGTDRAFYDEFFDKTKQAIVPLLHAIIASNRTMNQACIDGRFDERRQWDLSNDLCDLVGINKNAHYLTATVHPYSEAMTSHYAVTATNIEATNVMGNVYTMLHELGHGLYEQGVNPAYNRTSLKGGTSMGMHEAQSRFFENLIGRDRAFMDPLLALLRNRFPGQMGRVTPNQLYRAVNCVKPTLVRTEADEVTYSLHILIRYEIEQLLIGGKAVARDVPQLWAQRYDTYLGIRPSGDLNGALQDVHWAMGDFGYFPAYALGNAYAAQLRDKILEVGIDWNQALQSGDLRPIRDWLGKNIWWYGRSKDARELIEQACDSPFDTKYYIDYLTNKYDSLYNLRLG